MEKTTRDPGFYWIKDWRGNLQVAEWRLDAWWLTGNECEQDDVEVRSDRLEEPAQR